MENFRLRHFSIGQLVEAVNAALRNFDSLLTLASSPLVDPDLIKPALVLDTAAPSSAEKGRAVRFLLGWAVERLAPTLNQPALDSWDDPRWRDPLWWQYNLLFHRYIRPIHPDDFVAGGRYTETLLSLTGIPSETVYFSVRTQAIRSVAELLLEQIQHGRQSEEIAQRAYRHWLAPLAGDDASLKLLMVATTFRGVFQRSWLEKLAQAERLTRVKKSADKLIEGRFLQAIGQDLQMSQLLRENLRDATSKAQRRRHARAADLLLAVDGDPLEIVWQWQQDVRHAQAATYLLDHQDDLWQDDRLAELLTAISGFDFSQLDGAMAVEVLILSADTAYRFGDLVRAKADCQQGLTLASTDIERGRLYRRLGKLNEVQDQQEALRNYNLAADYLPSTHNECADVLKDRAWLNILRQDWSASTIDIQAALQWASPSQQADLYDALAILHSRQSEFDFALKAMDQALLLREELGDWQALARSRHNVGLIHNAMKNYPKAVGAFQAALIPFQRLGNHKEIATCLLNLGTAHHFAGDLTDAIASYEDCLISLQRVPQPLLRVLAHANLCEALAELNHQVAANHHWQTGFRFAQQHGFETQVAYYQNLLTQYELLSPPQKEMANEQTAIQQKAKLGPIAQLAVKLIRDHGRLTARQLTEAGSMSKATATRHLQTLVKDGVLTRHGQRRGTFYTVSAEFTPPSPQETVWPTIVSTLTGQATFLRDRYSLQRVGQVDHANSIRLALGFDVEPTLNAFFQLEQYLNDILPEPVDVWPRGLVSADKITDSFILTE